MDTNPQTASQPKTTARRRRKTPAGDRLLKSVRIRMYRQGLGDCFLLSFTNSRGEQHHLLIDCGVLPFSKGGAARLDLAAEDILAETGRRIHTVVATHEHADHISGFASAAEILGLGKKKPTAPVKVEQIWLAWTEDPADTQTRRILENARAVNLAVQATLHGLDESRRKAVEDLLLFNGATLEGEGLAAEGGKYKIATSMAAIMDDLRAWAEVDYLEPGEQRTLEGFGVKVHVLGPSRRMRMLAGGASFAPDERKRALTPLNAFLAAATRQPGFDLGAASKGDYSPSDILALQRLSQPFDASRSLTLEEAAEDYPLAPDARYPEKLQARYRQFFRTVYGAGESNAGRSPDWFGADWRRIGQDWLGLGERLALQQVSTINNTSLVLAFELVESGKVLLFAGDAEEQNWETWEAPEGEVDRLDELLRKTVVYKVGHHGSINATDAHVLATKMCSKELVALIPVDVEKAGEKGWQFPAVSLYDPQAERPEDRGLLYTRTAGRVVMNCPAQCAESQAGFEAKLKWPGKLSRDNSPERLWVDYLLTF
jgi:hypothetical protein